MTRNPIHCAPRTAPRGLLLLILLLACLQAVQAGDRDQATADKKLREAELALQDHRYKEAAAGFREAAMLSERPEIARQATRVAYTYGFNELALDAAGRWAKLDPDSDEAVLYIAQLHLRLGNTRKARRSFEDLLERSGSPPGESLLSLIPILSRESEKEGYEVMRWLARRHDESAEAQYAVAVMALQAGDTEEAGKRAQRSIELNGEWIKPRLLYARSLLLAGDEDKAIDYAARVVGDDPHPDPEARMELAILYMSVGRDDDALSQVNQILLEQPARTDALRLMAIINFRQENLDAARADFQDLLASGHYTMDALYYLARIADYQGEHDRAVALYAQVNNGQHVVPSQRRASSLIAHDSSLERALDHLQEFGEKHPKFAVDMLLAQAQLLASEQENERSLEIYNRVISYRPDSPRVVLGRGEVMLRLGKIDEAIASYRSAVKRWPDNAMALNALGYTLTYHSDDYREAARLIEKALELEPGSAAIIDSWGWVLYRLGRNEAALEQLERAWSMMHDPEIAAHIVEVLWKLERVDEARERLDLAAEMFPNHPMLEELRESLDGTGSDRP